MQGFEQFYNKKILSLEAFGKDEFDFTSWSCYFDVGETGYAVLSFDNGKIYISTDGLTSSLPNRPSVKGLPMDKSVAETWVGKVLESIEQKAGNWYIKLKDCHTICCRYEENDGHCDRDYMCVELDNWAAFD